MADIGTLNPEQMLEQQKILRQQKMAEMLMQQGMQQPQSQMVSGRYVAPSIFQNLAGLANTYVGQQNIKEAQKEQLDLAKLIRSDEISAMADFNQRKETGNVDYANLYANPKASAAQRQFAFQKMNEGPIKVGVEDTLIDPRTMKPVFTGAGKLRAPLQADTGAFIEYRDPTDPTKILARVPKSISPADAARMQFEGITGGGMPTGASAQAAPTTYRTINQGNPILAPNQAVPQQNVAAQMPQQEVMPRFNTKAEQEVWVASQKDKNRLQTEARAALPTALNTVNSGIKAIEGMIGDTTVDAKGNLVYGKIKPAAGFEAAVGMPTLSSGFGLSSFFKGSDYKDFEARFKEIEGKSFLSAIDSLRGTGAISEVEGAKATAAINRMSLSQSEKEFVLAANELKDVMTRGYQAAQQKAGVQPFNPTAQPNVDGAKPKRLVYNQRTGAFE